MDDFDQKLDTILNNPDLMQQIMSLAAQLNTTAPPKQEEPTPPKESPLPGLDGNVLRGISNLLNHSGIDKNQQALIYALKPYIGAEKAQKLEKAMQASKMAQLASVYLNKGHLRQASGG